MVTRLSRSGAQSLLIMAAFAVGVSGCAPVFTGVRPTSGQTCDLIEIERHPSRRHRCGNLVVELDGSPARDACIEGGGANGCVPPRPGTDGDLVFTVPAPWRAGAGTLNVQQTTAGTGCPLLGAFATRRGGYDFPFTVTRQLQPPVVRLTAEPETIDPGDSATLRWEVTGSTTEVRFGSETVGATGSRTVSPTTTQRYAVTAHNVCLTGVDRAEVCVNPAQSRPRITSVNRVCPGASAAVRGSGLTYAPCSRAVGSSVLFSQGGRPFSPVSDSTPSASRLEVILPSALRPGRASAVAQVGGMESPAFDFEVGGRRDGTFRESMLRQSGPTSCSSSGGVTGATLDVAVGGRCPDPTDICRTATYRRGTRTVKTVTFALGGSWSGAGISPDCDHAVVVEVDTFRRDDSYTLSVYDLDSPTSPRHRQIQLGTDIKVLFSRDDTLVLYKSVRSAGGGREAAVALYDLQRARFVPGTPVSSVACSACTGLGAELRACNLVRIDFDGRQLRGAGPDDSFPVE